MIEVSHSSVGISTGRLGADGSDGKASGTTYAAFSPGSLIIRDQANQQQDVSELSRDVEHANQSISPIFDKAKEQQRLSRLRLIGDVVNQGVDITLTQGQIMANNAGINAAGKWDETKETRKEYWDRVQSTAAYKDISEQYKAGGDLDKGIRAAASAITALAGGDPLKALAQGAAPYMAGVVKDMKVGFDDNPTAGQIAANAIGHAVLGGVIAELSGGNATAGAVGAATGELAARAIKDYLYPDTDIAHLSNGDKDKISNLASLAAILAGSVASDSSAGAVSGHDAGKNAVDNNYLTVRQIDDWVAEVKSCQAKGGDCGPIMKKYQQLSIVQQEQLVNDCANDPDSCQTKYGSVLANSMAVKEALNRAMGEDIPWAMSYDLSAIWAQQIDVDGVVASNHVSEVIMARWGLNREQADIVASIAASAIGGVGKASGGKGSKANTVKGSSGSALPTATPSTAQNGLSYKSNPKHTAGQQGYSFKAGTEPRNSLDLFGSSIESGKKRYAKDADGNVHQFTNTNDGTWHWSGSTGDKSAPLNKNTIPSDVKKQLNLPKKGW
ncbi:Putative large exoprotein involved in heme utilization or adhesion of ShlA/HecA/FhaA family [Pectobacterium sp. F1-1]|uniref:VENN motif pre-toxin domain-containing protein n=1 Tax=Pectobacterium sp. F1-1 TaxID=2949614 RepID=UPI0021D7C27C|nr:VENN motif pre-toxin domain-containing protein [Pectobacterium sp. F1-1]UYA60673.1 Putative large exoprotein involved in heme utilization or adhesion of ShlA/HecA/FhaA family [Pectobacterium sp. F1-1]